MNMTDIKKTATKTAFDAGRLPVTAAERLFARGETAGDWPPAVAFDGVQATVKQFVGSLLRDDELVEEGRLQQVRVNELRRAAELEATAEARRLEADQELQQRRQAADQRRQAVERQADAQEQAIDRQKAEQKRQVQEKARSRQETARKVEHARQKAVTAQERSAKSTRLSAESQALRERERAVKATGKALDLDETIEASKERRRAQA